MLYLPKQGTGMYQWHTGRTGFSTDVKLWAVATSEFQKVWTSVQKNPTVTEYKKAQVHIMRKINQVQKDTQVPTCKT